MVPFQAVNLLIRENAILPRRRSTSRPWYNVIDITLVRSKLFAGVLALSPVSFPNPSGRKLWPAFRHFVVTSQDENCRHPNQAAYRTDGVVLFPGLQF